MFHKLSNQFYFRLTTSYLKKIPDSQEKGILCDEIILVISPDDSYEKEDDSDDEQDMDESSDSIGWNESEYPEDEEDDSDSLEHREKCKK